MSEKRLFEKESAYAIAKLGLPADSQIYCMAIRIETVDVSELFPDEEAEYPESGLLSKDDVIGLVEEKIQHIKLPKGWMVISVENTVEGELVKSHHLIDMSDFKRNV